MSSRSRRLNSPLSVALTTFAALLEPRDLVRMSRTPADSSTARTVLPTMMPVPGDAGRRSTRAPPYAQKTSCGMVASLSDTGTICRRASSPPRRMASATSLALPKATPTRPRLSPTTTSVLKLNRRPPLTTLDERLMKTTFSVSSSEGCPSSVSSDDSPPGRPRRPRPGRAGRWPAPSGLLMSATVSFFPLLLKLQSGFARRVGQRLDFAVVPRAAAVEHHLLDAFVQRRPRRQSAKRFGALDIRGELLAVGRRLAARRSGRQRRAGVVVNELHVDVLVGKAHAHPRAFLRAVDFLADPPAAQLRETLFLFGSHFKS